MDLVILDRDLTEIVTDVMPRRLVMIAGNIDHARAVPRLAKQLLDDVIMFLRPVETFLELPAIDNVTDQIERLATRIFEKMEE